MDIEIMKSAADKRFTDFSSAVKQELKTKLANHSTVQNYTSEYDRIQNMKSLFSQINNPSSED